MAETNREKPKVGDKELNKEEEGQYDPRVDFHSELFDPLEALRRPDLRPPVPDARCFDNLAHYEAHYKKLELGIKTNVRTLQSAAREAQQVAEFKKQRFANILLPTPSTSKNPKSETSHKPPPRKHRTVLGKMIQLSKKADEGVLGALSKVKTQNLRVKVVTRHAHGIRGYLLAQVTAFDKYWNLMLKDVEEVWTRRKIRKIPAGLESAGGQSDSRLAKYFPEVTIVKATTMSKDHGGEDTKKTETCRRFVNELLVRGEQVVFIVIEQGHRA